MQEWTKEELFAKIYNFLLDSKIQFEKRDILLRAKQNLEQGQSVNSVLKRLHSDLQHIRRLGASALTGALLDFDDEISSQIGGKSKVTVDEKQTLIKKAKRAALIGAIAGSLLSISPIMLGLSLSSYFPNLSLVIIAFDIISLISFWFGFLRIDDAHGVGWSIYLLIIGISSLLGGFIQILNAQLLVIISPIAFATPILSFIAGISWILGFTFRIKAKPNVEGKVKDEVINE